MTQLSLFDSPSLLLDAPVVALPTRKRAEHRFAAHAPAHDANDSETPSPAVAPNGSLIRLARLIHDGNHRSKPPRSGQVNRIGDLARIALARHDLVARRRDFKARRRDSTAATPVTL